MKTGDIIKVNHPEISKVLILWASINHKGGYITVRVLEGKLKGWLCEIHPELLKQIAEV